MSETTVKVYIWGSKGEEQEIRIIRVKSFEDFLKFLGLVLKIETLGDYVLQWRNDEGEWITFSTPLEWNLIDRQFLRVRVFLKGDSYSSSFGVEPSEKSCYIYSSGKRSDSCELYFPDEGSCSFKYSQKRIFNVLDFGAVGDGEALDTKAIHDAFTAAGRYGGGKVIFPGDGKKYITAPISVTSNTEIVIEKGATILGVQDKNLYPVIDPLPSYGKTRDYNDGYYRYQPLIFGKHVKNVKICGEGVIDGQGEYWWNLHRNKKLCVGRPRLVEFLYSKNIEICGIKLQNSGFWTLHPTYSENIHIHDLSIYAPPDSNNTDGINPDSSKNVLIERVRIDCGNDHIAIKSGMDDFGISYDWPATNIEIRDCVFGRGRGITIGSETSGGVSNVYVHDCEMAGPSLKGAFIKTGRGRGNVIESIVYENIHFSGREGQIDVGIVANMNYCNIPPQMPEKTPVIRNITYRNLVFGDVKQAGLFLFLDESPGKNIKLENVKFEKFEKGFKCENVSGTQVNCVPNPF